MARSRPDKYILAPDHTIIPEPDLLAWAYWMETADRRVDHTVLIDGSEVSTVFLGLDVTLFSDEPRTFETAWFDKAGDIRGLWRSRTWEEAFSTHQLALVSAREALGVE